MQRANVGSVLVVDGTGIALGILTRHDLLSRAALRDPPPPDIHHTSMREVMTHPVRSRDVSARVHDAALLMSRHGIRHVPPTGQGRIVGVVSERDPFALQRLSPQQLSGALGSASEVPALATLAPKLGAFARDLLAHGMSARTLTDLVSHRNDPLTKLLLELLAAVHGLDLARGCWLARGSEGRPQADDLARPGQWPGARRRRR
jgi:CBS domain-containing protein